MKVAFYAPMKEPGHALPSGDRQMARQLMRALELAGHEVQLASRFSSFEATGDPARQAAVREAGLAEAEALIRGMRGGERPDLWFTYHPYYKAPDWIGVEVAAALDIPYVTAEASYAGKRDNGPFAMAQAQVRRGLALARVNFCFTPADREGIARVARPGSLVDLPPFIDTDLLGEVEVIPAPEAPARLLAVGMMRSRDKLDSYRILAKALYLIQHMNFTLRIVGDGPERQVVEALFQFLGPRVRLTGQLPPEQMAAAYAEADLYLWPGCGEAYGLAYLEAQAMGLPVVAQHIRGVPSVVQDGVTGVLTAAEDVESYAAAIATLIEDGARRRAMGQAARHFVRAGRCLPVAAEIIRGALA
jgi:glycosyltransferase involved in cell wall biosynthesis